MSISQIRWSCPVNEAQYDFSDLNVLVTGGGQGIGFETTRKFLLGGARVTIWEASLEAADHACTELAQFSTRLKCVKVDVTQSEQVIAAAANIEPIHVLVNNAGITLDSSFAKMRQEDFERVLKVNLVGPYVVTHALLQKFAESGPKRIINISSVVARFGNFGQANYVASKAGVEGFTRTLARELSRKGFTVNAVAPGFTATPMTRAMPPNILEETRKKIPLGNLAEPAQIADAILFLASSSASYINGCILPVDGGLSV